MSEEISLIRHFLLLPLSLFLVLFLSFDFEAKRPFGGGMNVSSWVKKDKK